MHYLLLHLFSKPVIGFYGIDPTVQKSICSVIENWNKKAERNFDAVSDAVSCYRMNARVESSCLGKVREYFRKRGGRKSWRILIPITPLLLRSMNSEIMGVTSPPIMLEMKRAEVMAFDLSMGFGDIAADRPQNGMSPIV